MRTTNLRRRADDDIHAHLVAFIAHQYYRLHDNLVDVLLTSVRTFENTTLREHRDWCFHERKRHEHATEGLLDDLDMSVFQILRQIREAIADERMSAQEKVEQIGILVLPEQTAETKSRELRASLANDAADDHYFDILESRSVRLQNQVGGILKAITFQAGPHIAGLEAAIARFVATDGNLDRTAPAAFLNEDERAAVWTGLAQRRGLTDAEELGCLLPAHACCHRADNPLAQIQGVRTTHRCWPPLPASTLNRTFSPLPPHKRVNLRLACSSLGMNTDNVRDVPFNEVAFMVERGSRVRREVGIPVGVSWNLGLPAVADRVIRQELIDLVLLGRPALSNPHWPVWAARELAHNDPFSLIPQDWSWWLRNRPGPEGSLGWPASPSTV